MSVDWIYDQYINLKLEGPKDEMAKIQLIQ